MKFTFRCLVTLAKIQDTPAREVARSHSICILSFDLIGEHQNKRFYVTEIVLSFMFADGFSRRVKLETRAEKTGCSRRLSFGLPLRIGWFSNGTGTSVDNGKAREDDLILLPVPNLSLCHWSSQLFDLRAPSSTDVPVLFLNQPNVWNAQNTIWSRAFGTSITRNPITHAFDHLSRETYAKQNAGGKAFWPSIVLARTL